MFEKNLEIGLLLDFYGEMLSERKRTVMNLYYNEDYSLAEIADEIGISRQGVRDLIKKSEVELSELEAKLGLAKRFATIEELARSVRSELEGADIPEHLKNSITKLIDAAEK